MMQSTRFDVYRAALDKLRALDVVYPCWATRREIKDYIRDSGRLADWPIDPDGAYLYPGLYRDITTSKRNALMWEDTHYAWRLNMEKAHALAQKK